MNEFDPQLVDEACYPATRLHRWFARAQCILFLTVLFLVAYGRDTRLFLILAIYVLLLAFGSEVTCWHIRKTCNGILLHGEWRDGVVTAKRTTRPAAVQRMTVAVQNGEQTYEREAVVSSKTYSRFHVGQTVQARCDHQLRGRWVLLKDATDSQAKVDR